MPPSQQIDELLALCLVRRTGEAVHRIERDGLWEYFAVRACDAPIAGLVEESLDEPSFNVPASAAAQLRNCREHLAAQTAYQLSRVLPVMDELEREGVPFLVLKGAALDATVFQRPGLRGMNDVDVLIRPEDAKGVDALLTRMGCTPGPDLVRSDFYPRYYYEREYFTPDHPPVKIDLHVRPFRPLRYARTVPDHALWEIPQRVSLHGQEILIPGAEDMLLHLAVHAACHGLSQLRWLYDIHAWWRHSADRLDLDRVFFNAQAWKVELPLRRALHAVIATLGDPDGRLTRFVERLAPRAAWTERLVLRQAPRDAEHPFAGLVVNLMTTPGRRFRLGYLMAVLFPEAAHLRQLYSPRHPGWQLFAHTVRAARAIRRFIQPASIASE